MRFFRYSWTYFFLIVSLPAFSADAYYSTPINASSPKYYGSSAFAAANAGCRALFPPSGNWTMTGQPTVDVGRWECRHGAVGGYYVAGNVYVYEVCSSGTASFAGQCSHTPNGEPCGTSSAGSGVEKIKNSSGECVEPWDADKPSFCKYLSRNTRFQTVSVGFREDGTVIPPSGTASVEGCESVPVDYTNCKMPVARKACANGNCVTMQPLQGNCRVATNFTGNVSDNSAPSGGFTGVPGDTPGLCPPGESCIGPTPPDVTDNQPCTYEEVEGRRRCTSFNFVGKPGDTSCYHGSVGGSFGCYGNTSNSNGQSGTLPSSSGTQIDTTITTTNNPNGTTTTTKLDKHQQTICAKPGSCVTNNTTVKSVTVRDGNGNTLSQTTDCVGPNCASGGTGGKGDSNGDGLDDCATGADCGEESVAGVPGTPELEEVSSIDDATGDYFGRISNAPIVSAITNFAVPTGGSCPVYAAQTMIGTFDSSSFCNLAPELLSGLRYLFLALWAWAAVRLFMTA